jgi:hypothetical protein
MATPPDRLDESLAINGHGDSTPHADVVEGGLIGAQGQHRTPAGLAILIPQVGMTLLERLQVLLAHDPPLHGATVELPGAVHRQPGRRVLDHQPLHPVHVRLAVAEVCRVPREDSLHVRFVVLQDEGARANGALGFFQVPIFLYHFGGDDHHARHLGERVEQPNEGLFQDELDRITIHDLDPIHRLQEIAVRIPMGCQAAVKGELHVLCHELAAVEGRFVVPFYPLAQVENVGRLIRCVPAFGEVGLHREGAR